MYCVGVQPSAILSLAALSDGRVVAVTGDSCLYAVLPDRLESFATLSTPGTACAVAVSPSDAIYVLDAFNHCIHIAGADGQTRIFAGAPQPFSLGKRPRSTDGPAATATFRGPQALAATRDALLAAEVHEYGFAIRRIAGDRVETLNTSATSLLRITAMSPGPDGSVLLADSTTPAPCLYRLAADGTISIFAGSPDEPGDSDSPVARDARFVRPLAMAFDGRLGWFVADGVRIRHVSLDGAVRTVAGGDPGYRDGVAASARFQSVRALAVRSRGAVVIADPVNQALRVIDPDGTVSTLLTGGARKAAPPAGRKANPPMTDEEFRRLERRFGDELAQESIAGALAIADLFLNRARNDRMARPDRTRLPVSVASALVGRELARAWCLSNDAGRVRLGACCLWLIRCAEGIEAPRSDAALLAGAIESALVRSDFPTARGLCDAVDVAFGGLARRRDRLSVAAAFRTTRCAEQAIANLGSHDPETRSLAIDLLRQSRDIRSTPVLAAIALDDPVTAAQAREALGEIWNSPAYSPEQLAELKSSLRFSRPIVERLFARYGDDALGSAGSARYRAAVSRSGD